MARPPRLLAAGAFYHLTCRGVRKLPIYETDRDRMLFLALLRLTLRGFHWRCHAYCLMPNHFHLLAETSDPNLSAGMHWLNTAYARIFNKRHGYSGHLFDRRFYSGLVEGDVQFALRARYIDLNPVRAKAVRAPRRLAVEQLPVHRGTSAELVSDDFDASIAVRPGSEPGRRRVRPVRPGRDRVRPVPCGRCVTPF